MHARNFTTNVPKILDLKSSSEQIFFRKLSLGAQELLNLNWLSQNVVFVKVLHIIMGTIIMYNHLRT